MKRATVFLTLVLVLAPMLLVASAVLSEQEARKEFEAKACTSCHNNNIAPDFDGTVAKLVEWAKKYNTLDEAVAAEAKTFKMFSNAKTWNQLMNMMPGITPELKEFFENIFEQAKKGKEVAAPATPTPTQMQPQPTPQPPTTAITTTPVKPSVKTLPTITVEDPSAASKQLVRKAAIAGFAAYLIAIGILIALLARRGKEAKGT